MHNNEKKKRLRRAFNKTYPFVTVFFWFLIIFGFADPCTATMTLTSALIHEFGHVTYLYIWHSVLTLPRGRVLGFRLKRYFSMSYSEEAAYYAAGPLANIVVAVIGVIFVPLLGDYGILLTVINLATAVANLLPLDGHDGYGILRAVICRFGMNEEPLSALSLLCSCIMCLISLYTVDRLGEGYFIFAVLLLSMIGSMGKRLPHTKNEIY